jgi:hypothetical protein
MLNRERKESTEQSRNSIGFHRVIGSNRIHDFLAVGRSNRA